MFSSSPQIDFVFKSIRTILTYFV